MSPSGSRQVQAGRDVTLESIPHLRGMNRLLYTLCVMFVVLGIGGALTLRGQGVKAINARNDVAIQGYDVVAYFTDGKAVPGQASITAEAQGVTWRFATPAHRDLFVSEPAKYIPQFGGYCAYGVSRGYAVDIDPRAFAVLDGKLYLNYSLSVQRTWNGDRATFIERANGNWPTVLADLTRK